MGKKRQIVVVGFGLLLLFYLTWCLATISNRWIVYEGLHMVSTLLLMSGYVLWGRMIRKNNPERDIVRQLQIVNTVLILVFLLITGKDISRGDRSIFMISSDFIWLIGLEVFSMLFPVCWKSVGVKLVQWGKNHLVLFVLLPVCGVLACYPTMLQFKWDGALYEQAVWRMDIHSMSSMAAYAHIAQGYGILVCLARILYNDPQVAMAITNIFMYLSSILAMYGILHALLPEQKKIVKILGTLVYAFSPLTYGMVNYYSLDYATVCLFVCMIYFLIRKEWILQSIAAFFACFTKEPAIILYGGICVGIVIYDLISNRNIKKIIKTPQYYVMLVTAFLWYLTYKMLGGWNAGESAVGLEIDYFINKLEVLFLFNFTWIFTGIILIYILVFFRKQRKIERNKEVILGLLVGILFMSSFQAIIRTVNHVRYAAVVSMLCLVLAVYFICKMKENWYQKGFLIALTVIMGLSSWFTFDPVTKVLFEDIDVGNGKIATTGILICSDSTIYNKQVLYLEDAINLAIEDVVECQYELYVPTYNRTPNLFDGMMGEYQKEKGYVYTTQYWDEEKKKRVLEQTDDQKPFLIKEITDEENAISVVSEGLAGKRCYMYMPGVGEQLADTIRKSFDTIEEKSFTANDFIVYSIIF